MCLIIAYGTEFVLQFLLYTSEKSHAACDAENKDKDVVVVKIKPLAQGVDYDG